MIVPVDKLNGQRLFVEIHLHIRHVRKSFKFIYRTLYVYAAFNISNYITVCPCEEILQLLIEENNRSGYE